MAFEFATAAKIIFGRGMIQHATPLAAGWGKRVLLVTGKDGGRSAGLRRALESEQLRVSTFSVEGEPAVELVEAGVRQARQEQCEMVIGMGGGSVVDAGKAIAGLLTNPGDPLDYLEVVGKGQPLTEPAAPYMAIPTTAGTGAEVTRNAVLGLREQRVKVSLRSPLMLPRAAIVDSELTHSVPPAVTAATGLDALTQVIEPFVSRQANPLTDSLCRDAIARGARALPAAFAAGDNASAREDMSLVSLFGGLALANAKLGAVHGIAGPLGGMFPAAHGATCAALLPHTIEVNIAALQRRDPGSRALSRYDEIAQLLTGSATARARDGVEWLKALCRELRIPRVSSYGVGESDFPQLIEKAERASSMKGNPIQLHPEELREILSQAL